MNTDDLVAKLRAAIELELNRTDWPHRPSCQMLRNPPKGLFDGFSCNCDAATMWMLMHEANRKILDDIIPQLEQAEAWQEQETDIGRYEMHTWGSEQLVIALAKAYGLDTPNS